MLTITIQRQGRESPKLCPDHILLATTTNRALIYEGMTDKTTRAWYSTTADEKE